MKRSIRIILTLSILLNVILVGLVAGGSYRIFRHFGPDPEMRKELSTLPPDVRKKIDDVFEDARKEMFVLFQEERQAKQDVRDALNADPFVAEDYERAVNVLHQVKLKMLQGKARKTAAIAANLSPEDRRRFAGYLLRGMLHGRHKGGGRSLDEGSQKLEAPLSNKSLPAQMPQDENTKTSSVKPALPFDAVMLPMPDVD